MNVLLSRVERSKASLCPLNTLDRVECAQKTKGKQDRVECAQKTKGKQDRVENKIKNKQKRKMNVLLSRVERSKASLCPLNTLDRVECAQKTKGKARPC